LAYPPAIDLFAEGLDVEAVVPAPPYEEFSPWIPAIPFKL